jgi:hypothetical protein
VFWWWLACLLNQSDKSKLRVSEKLIWLATWRRWTRPPLHACKTQWVRESCQNSKRRNRNCANQVSWGEFTLRTHLDNCNILFFTHTDWFYNCNPVCSSLNCCFRLQITVHRLAMILAVFRRNKRAKSVSAEKWKSEEYRSYLFALTWSCSFTIH